MPLNSTFLIANMGNFIQFYKIEFIAYIIILLKVYVRSIFFIKIEKNVETILIQDYEKNDKKKN